MGIALQYISRALRNGLALGLLSSLASLPAQAAGFYEGKQITLIVGGDAGSAYDAYSRLLSRHMGRHIEGNPSFIIQNMPGAGSIIAAQYLSNIATKDGTVFAMLFPGSLVEPLTGEAAKYHYSPVNFDYIGTADSGTRLCLTMASSGVRTIEDARSRKVVMAGTAPGSSTTDYAWFMNDLAGTKFEVIAGYKGPGDVLLAMERGEAAGVCALDSATVASLRPDWIATGKVNVLVQAGLEVNPNFKAPPLWDFIKGDNRAVAELIVSQQVFGRPFLAPPGTAAEPLRILRAAFMAAMKDPALLEEAKRLKLDVNPKSGEEIAALVKEMYSASPAVMKRLKKALRP
ncbi:MAG: efflux transporter protein [Hyphomicrobiales bacterium]|nr:efflux transporter protein [Hyphomicrobiales bacterium]